MNRYRHGRKFLVPALAVLALCLESQPLRAQNTVKETDLQSDIPGRAAHTDAGLVNPWGITYGPTTPFWVADNGSGLSTLYNTAGAKVPLTVSLPNPAGGLIAPTGAVFNGDAASYNGDRFIFASEDGVIAGWRNPPLGTTAETLFSSSTGAIYKGLANGSMGGHTYLYATDFHNGHIDVYPGAGAPAVTGTFTDPTIPSGFAPFGIQNIGGMLYVTYAKQDASGEDDVAGAGNGFVDIYNLNGDLQKRLVSMGALNSPWGLALAPHGFGTFGGDLLVGNFGDGMVNAYDPMTGKWLDMLHNPDGSALSIDGLWGLIFGNGAAGGDAKTLYFTAGIAGDGEKEDHGLFGSLSSVPDTANTGIGLGLGLAALSAVNWLRRRPKNQRLLQLA